MQKGSIRNCDLQYVFIRSLEGRYSVFSWLLTQTKFWGGSWTVKKHENKRKTKFTIRQRAGMEFEGVTREKPLPVLSQDFFQELGHLFF